MKDKKITMRRCIGCMESKPKDQLLRISLCAGKPDVDVSGKIPGRGLYLCPNEECIENARKKRSVQRGFKGSVTDEAASEFLSKLVNHEK